MQRETNRTRPGGAEPVRLRWIAFFRHWPRIARRTASAVNDDRIGLTAAGVAFYALLSVFPGLAAVISLWGLFADPSDIPARFNLLDDVLPAEVARVLREQAAEVASANTGAVSAALIAALTVSFFSASRAVKAVMQALNIVYDEKEKRGFIRFNLTALSMTVGVAVGFIAAIAAVAIVPVLLNLAGLGGALEPFIWIVRWPILFFGAWFGIAALYRFAPSRKGAEWKWISPGAGAAVVLWIVASAIFSVYVQNFANYNETYGSIGAVVVILMWFWISAFVFLVGAEVESEIEIHQRRAGETGRPQEAGR